MKSIEWFMRNSDSKTFQRESFRVGIGVGYANISAVAISPGKPGRILESIIKKSDVDYCGHGGMAHLKQHLSEVLQTVHDWIGKRYISVRVAIDDPFMYVHTIHFDTFPKQRTAQEKLVSWQMENAFGVVKDSLHVSFTSCAEKKSSKTIFVTGIKNELFVMINDLFASESIIPESIMMTSMYRQPKSVLPDNKVVVRVYTQHDYVSVLFWKSSGVPVFCRAFWRRNTSENINNDIFDTIRDISRTIHVYTASNHKTEIAKIVLHIDKEPEKSVFKNYFIDNEKVEYVDSLETYELHDLSKNKNELIPISSSLHAALA